MELEFSMSNYRLFGDYISFLSKYSGSIMMRLMNGQTDAFHMSVISSGLSCFAEITLPMTFFTRITGPIYDRTFCVDAQYLIMSFVRPKNTMITVNSAVMSFTESECITVQNIKSEKITVLRKTEYQLVDYLEPIFASDAFYSFYFKTLDNNKLWLELFEILNFSAKGVGGGELQFNMSRDRLTLGSIGRQRSLVEFPIAELEEYKMTIDAANGGERLESFVISFWEILSVFKWSCYHRTAIEFYRYPSMVKVITDKITMVLSLLNINSHGINESSEQVLVEESTTTGSEHDDYNDNGNSSSNNDDNNKTNRTMKRRRRMLSLDEWL